MDPLYKPQGVEQRWQQTWEDEGLYGADPDAPGETFVVMHPPPNISGSLTIGHCLQLSLEDTLVQGMAFASQWLANHAALQFMLAYEPETVLPHISFRRMNEVLATAAAFVAPYLARWLPADDALRAAEWGARIVLSYTSCPADDVDLADEASARRLVQTFVLPGLVTPTSK